MDGGNEQRVAIKFCFNAGLSATETPVLVQKAYGNEVLDRSMVFMWYSRYRFCTCSHSCDMADDDPSLGTKLATI